MFVRLVLLVITALCISPLHAATEAVSTETVQLWWKSRSSENMTIEGDLLEVRLKNGESAYLLPVAFYIRGRNDIWHTVLVRPKLQEVRELAYPVGRSVTVRDLDHDGVSEVITTVVESGTGSTVVVDSIVQIDGWTPVLLHQVTSGNNLGWCGPPPANPGPCESAEVEWRFSIATKDGKPLLTETLTTKKGMTPKKMKASSTLKRYFFAGDRFIDANYRNSR
jgi:hypothetical protein